MPAIPGRRKNEIKRAMLSKAKLLSTPVKRTIRGRKRYLEAVLNGNKPEMRKREKEIIRTLFLNGSTLVRAGLSKKIPRDKFIHHLRKGIPLSNATHLLELFTHYLQLENTRLPQNPAYRKPSVLKMELEIYEHEYVALRLARRNALAHGYQSAAEALAKDIERIAKKIASYNRLFKEGRLVQ